MTTIATEVRPAGALPESYFDLVRAFPLLPLRTPEAADAARAAGLAVFRRGKLDAGEAAYVSALGALIRDYDRTRPAPPAATEAEILEFLIESKGCTQADVADGTGIAATTISAVLNGSRQLRKEHIVALAKFFNITPATFLPGVVAE